MNYVKVDQVAKMLGLTEATVYKYIRNGKLNPYNRNDWQIDGEYHFDPTEVERAKGLLVKPGLSTSEVGKELNISRNTILKYIKDGVITASKQWYKGKEQYFIDPASLVEVKNTLQKDSQNVIYSKDLKCGLFQLFKKGAPEITGHSQEETIRIIDLTDPSALKENGDVIKIEELSPYQPVYNIEDIPLIKKKGYITFVFKKPAQIQSSVYSLIDEFYKILGFRNFKITVTDVIIVKVKPVVLPFNKEIHMDYIDLMKAHIKEGEIRVRRNGVFLISNLESTHTYLDKKVKQKLQREAKQLDKTYEEFVAEILEEYARRL